MPACVFVFKHVRVVRGEVLGGNIVQFLPRKKKVQEGFVWQRSLLGRVHCAVLVLCSDLQPHDDPYTHVVTTKRKHKLNVHT